MRRPLVALLLCAVVLLMALSLAKVPHAGAQRAPQGDEERIQRITARLKPGEIDGYLLKDLRPGNRLTVLMRRTSDDLDPAAGNILLFIAFSFSLASDSPRPWLHDVRGRADGRHSRRNVLVLLYNVYMEPLETEGKAARVERIDKLLDWVYPMMYVSLITLIAVVYL